MLARGKLLAVAVSLALAATSGCRRRSSAPPDPGDAGTTSSAAIGPLPPGAHGEPIVPALPPELRDASMYSEDVYSSAYAREWTRAERALRYLDEDVAAIRAGTVGDSADVDLLGKTAQMLHRAVDARRRFDTLHAANEVTLITANLCEPYGPLVPADLDRLAYYARALSIAAAQGDDKAVAERTEEIRRTWTKLHPIVEQKAGRVLALRLDSAISALATAPKLGVVEDVAKWELDELRIVRRAFAERKSSG